nr:serine hydrolase domain-containing protein [uncultured Allomuricauda sp.]
MKKRHYLLLSIFLTLSLKTVAQEIQTSQIEAKINALVPSQVQDSTPGLVVGIVKDGKLIFTKGYGLGNMAYNVPNDSKMLYNLGSVSKQFLGYAFAMLQSQGKLNLDDSVAMYLNDWPTFDHPVTLRHLLTHTSGYREAYTMSELAGRRIDVDRLSRDECLEVIRNQPKLEFVPGTRHTYNSTTYVVLSEILEKVTDTPADEWIETHIFRPLKMNNTQIESYVGELITNAAESYSLNSEAEYANEKSNRAIFGAADVYSSIEDLAKWFTVFGSDALGGKEARNLFLEPFILKDGTNTNYALGIRTEMHNGLKVYHHIGGHANFLSQLRYYPDYDLGIIVLSNFGRNGWLSASKIAELFLSSQMTNSSHKEIKQISIEKNKLQQLEGIYVAKTLNGTLNLSMADESLSLNGRNLLIPTSDNTFGIRGWNGEINIEHSTDSTLLNLINGQKETYYRVKKWEGNGENLKTYEGKYWSDELEIAYNLHLEKGELVIQNRWIERIKLQPISKDFFQSNTGYYLNFIRNNEGNIKGLSINSERTLDVYFHLIE